MWNIKINFFRIDFPVVSNIYVYILPEVLLVLFPTKLESGDELVFILSEYVFNVVDLSPFYTAFAQEGSFRPFS